MIIHWSMPNNKGTNPPKFRLLLMQGGVEKHEPVVPCSVYGQPSTEPPPKRMTGHNFLE
jgi:hypothetical protein